MRTHRFTLLFLTLTLLFMAPALAEDVVPTAAPATVPGATHTLAPADCTDGPAPGAETGLSASSQGNPALQTLEEMAPLSSETSSFFVYGYCYNDCSRCETREDCGGFACTEIRLC